MIEYKLPVITMNADGSLRGKGGLLVDEAVEFAKELEKAGSLYSTIKLGAASLIAATTSNA